MKALTQSSGLAAAQRFLDYANAGRGLDVTVSTAGAITIQVATTSPLLRVLTLAQLCLVLDVEHSRRGVGTHPWREATGEWDGHVVHVFAAITVAEQAELDQQAREILAGLEGVA